MRWDLFVLHAEADVTFVRGALLPALGLPRDRVLLLCELPLGTSVPGAIQEGVAASRITVAIVSPAFLHDAWARYGQEMAATAARTRQCLVPLVLADCALPLLLAYQTKLDCRDAAPAARALQFERLRALVGADEPPPREVPCPYPGMRPFSGENAALFCGRDREIDELVARLEGETRELYVVGPSGSGKSSLIAAGVLPRLERGRSGAAPFVVRSLRPGPFPAHALAAALLGTRNRTPSNPRTGDSWPLTPSPSRWRHLVERALAAHPPARRLVVFIDQLEEIFTLASASGRRELFAALDALRAVPACQLVFSVRADFFGALMSSELWPHVDCSPRCEVAPLVGDDLRAALAEPAARVGVLLEPALVERLLADAAAEPGLLAAVQETLVELWARRDRDLITLQDYLDLGSGGRSGLAVALARCADRTYARLTPAQRAVARRIFLRLISFGEGRADTRRRQPIQGLRDGQPHPEFAETLRVLTEDRLLTLDTAAGSGERDDDDRDADLSHEALITGWDRLQQWIRDHGADEQRRRALERQAEDWQARGPGRGGLLDDLALRELDGWLTATVERDLGVSARATELIQASRHHLARTAADARHQAIAPASAMGAAAARRRRWIVAAALLAAAVAAETALLIRCAIAH